MDVKIFPDVETQTITALIYGDIDHHTSKYIRGEIDSAIKKHHPKKLIIDFANVTFMDSSGIGLLMGRYKQMSEISGEVKAANPPSYIRKVMQLSGIHKLCPIITIQNNQPTDINGEKITCTNEQ